MKSGYLAAVAVIPVFCSIVWGAEAPKGFTNMGNVKGGDPAQAQRIIDTKCTKCHSSKIVESAIIANKDMIKIQREMEKKGAKLEASERDVLGIYWKQQNPLKTSK